MKTGCFGDPYPGHDDLVVGVVNGYMHTQTRRGGQIIIDLVVKDLHLVIT